MARRMKSGWQALSNAAFAGAVAALCAGTLHCYAQSIPDPTRPPAQFTAGDEGASASGPVLQSVKISPTERSAIIGGDLVKLGGKYGDARVVKITEREVVLRSAAGIQTLRMYPDVEISPVVAPAPTTPAPNNTSGRAKRTRKSGKQE